MILPHPLTTSIIIKTATFEGPDSVFPDTQYGRETNVKVITHDHDGDPRSTTVSIGGKMYPLGEIEYILDAVKRHQAAVKAWNK